MNVLFVCTGNICRSPMAEGIAANVADKSHIVFRSAGTFAYDGTPASPNAVAVLKEKGIDISAHRARRFDARLAMWADLILAMETAHIRDMTYAAPTQAHKMHTLLGFAAGEKGTAGDHWSVADPYGGSLDIYRKARDEIADAIVRIFGSLEE